MKKTRVRIAVQSLMLITLSSLAGRGFAASYSLSVDAGDRLADLPHFWSKCVGTGTMEFCLKPGVADSRPDRRRGGGIRICPGARDSHTREQCR